MSKSLSRADLLEPGWLEYEAHWQAGSTLLCWLCTLMACFILAAHDESQVVRPKHPMAMVESVHVLHCINSMRAVELEAPTGSGDLQLQYATMS